MHDLFLAIYLWISSMFGGGTVHFKPEAEDGKPQAEEGETRPAHSSFAPDSVDHRANPINNGY